MHRSARHLTALALFLAVAAGGPSACTSQPDAARVADADSASLRPGSFAVIDGEPAPVPPVPMGDQSTVRRVIRTARTDSRVMEHLTSLCENFGARLTGSTACDQAGRWARDRFEAWGLENARLEKWGDLDARFDRLEASGEIVTKPRRRGDDDESQPGSDEQAEPEWNAERTIEFTTLSWTRGTDGPVVGNVLRMPETLDEANLSLDRLTGAWVLLPARYSSRRGVRGIGYSMRARNDLRHEIRTGVYDPFSDPKPEAWTGTVQHHDAALEITFFPTRDERGRIAGGRIEMPALGGGEISEVVHEDDTLRMVWQSPLEQYEIELEVEDETMAGKAGDQALPVTLSRTQPPDEHAATRETDRVLARVLEADPAGFISASSDERVWTTRPNGWRETDPGDLPRDIEISVRRSDYDYINSRLADGQEVFARFNLHHRVDPGPVPVYNTIAEIPGATRPDEVVIVSAHLDSWDGPGSQGTTDNGTGSAVVLEAARLLANANARPDRTIRFVLWTGEEQGLLGSRAYVESLSEEEKSRISAVFVDDGGTNYEGGLPAADCMVEYLAAATAPINNQFYSETDGEYLNVNIRPTGESLRTHGGSDHASFNRVGVPGFFWDEVGRSEYGYGWHTQNDRLDLAIPEYLAQSSACMAVTAYNLACAPGLLPREDDAEPVIAMQTTTSTGPAEQHMARQAATGR